MLWKKPKNLIICTTPFQVLIAERIVKLYPSEKFYGILIWEKYQEKYEYYKERLKAACGGAEYYIVSNSMSYSQMFRIILKSFGLTPVDKVFASSYDSLNLRLLISQLRTSQLYSFDDGTLHISSSAYNFYYSKQESHGRLYRYLRVPTIQEIESRIVKHYTIYRLPNMSSAPLEYVSLFELSSSDNKDTVMKVVRILLGQPIYEYVAGGREMNITTTQDVLNKYQIDFYLPHPREMYRIDGVNYINTNLLFEDYIIECIKQNPDTLYEVYSFCSSSLLNLEQGHNLRFISLRPKEVPENLIDIYDLIENAGISVVEL